jgi:hypothetical protein
LLVNIDSSISGSESKIAYEVDVKGVANGAEPIPRVSHDWHLKLQLDVEYFPIHQSQRLLVLGVLSEISKYKHLQKVATQTITGLNQT